MSPKRKLIKQKGLTKGQIIAHIILGLLVLGYILLNGYTQSLGIQNLIDISIKIISGAK